MEKKKLNDIDPSKFDVVAEEVNEYQGFIRNAEGEIEKVDLVKHSVKVRPKVAALDLEKLLVREAPKTVIRPTKRKRPQRSEELTIVAGDAQIPFHDERAMELFLAEVLREQPDNIVLVGDMIDLPSLSRFQQRPEWVGQTQSAIDTYHMFLAKTRANAPHAKIFVIHGNHEQRLDNYIQNNAAEVLGLRRANMPQELAVLSIQSLVRYADLGIESIDGYPNGTLWMHENLKFVHGTNVAKGGSNAAKYLREERETTVYGHTHRMELAYRTFPRKLGSVTIAAASPGCLAKIDGSVPSYRSTYDAQGHLVRRAEDWQQGILKIYHTSKSHHIVPIRFIELEEEDYE